jgi:histone-lysine N-methyltransferase SETMAR
MGKLSDLHYELLEHPPYSPDLASSDFCLFPKLKLFLAGQRFSSNQEAIAAVEGYFAHIMKNHYRDGIMALEHRWNKCISLKGDYVENKNNFEIINLLFIYFLFFFIYFF